VDDLIQAADDQLAKAQENIQWLRRVVDAAEAELRPYCLTSAPMGQIEEFS